MGITKSPFAIIILPFFLIFQSCVSTVDHSGWTKEKDKERLAKLSPEALLWEKKLEANLDESTLLEYKTAALENEEHPFAYVLPDPKLPNVLIVGDRISVQYTLVVRKKLEGIANVYRIPSAGSDSNLAAQKIKGWTDFQNKWDVIHFNIGMLDGKTSPYDYALNLRQITRVLKRTKAHLIWATTTPSTPSSLSVKLNEIAAKTMRVNKIETNDLYSAILPTFEEDRIGTGSALNEDGIMVLADKVSEAIRKALKK